jgi:mono/diheme cytochrome c family protein
MNWSLRRQAWLGRVALCGALGLAAGGAAWADTPDAARLEEGRALFQKNAVPACAVCHTLEDAQATGPIGPNLDELQPDRDQVLAALRDGGGAMPSFAETLTQAQRETVADYVVWATHPH